MQKLARCAFTLIEMLVVVVVIAILAGIVFRMIAVVSRHGDRSRTMARVQRVANAVEGFHAEYGQYPPVPFYDGEDWYCVACDRAARGANPPASCSRCGGERFALYQPLRYEFPDSRGMRPGIALALANRNPGWGDPANDPNQFIVFTFGAMSFLVDRYAFATQRPYPTLFSIDQWAGHNAPGDPTLDAYARRDRAAVQKWAPQLEGIIATYNNLQSRTGPGGQVYTNRLVRVLDAWDRELRYASPPPYQEYRVWSREPGSNVEIGSGNWDR